MVMDFANVTSTVEAFVDKLLVDVSFVDIYKVDLGFSGIPLEVNGDHDCTFRYLHEWTNSNMTVYTNTNSMS